MNENATHGSPLSDGPAPPQSATNLDPKATRLSFSIAIRRIAWGLVFFLAAWVTWKGFTSEPARETLQFDWYSTTFGLIYSPLDEEEPVELAKPAHVWIELVERELDSTTPSADRCLESIGLFLTLADLNSFRDENESSLYVRGAARVWKRMHQFAPDEPRLWRTLARSKRLGREIADMFPEQGQSRLEQFAEAVRHDPRNSLYQYLAAPALQQVAILVKLDEEAAHSPMSPSDLARIRAARTLHNHFAELPKETPLVDLQDDRVSVLRALGWIPFDRTERRRWAQRLFPFIRISEDVAWAEALFERPDVAEIRQYWECTVPRSPTFDYRLKKIAATDEELVKSRRDREIENSLVPAPSSETMLNLLISEAALERVDELRGLNSTQLLWITELTRNRLLVIGLFLVVLGAIGGLLSRLPLKKPFATHVSSQITRILTLFAALFGMTLAALLILLVFVDYTGLGVEPANQCVLWIPAIGFGVLEIWLVRRILGSRLAVNRPVRIAIMIIAIGGFVGWGLLYQSVITSAEYSFLAEFTDVLDRHDWWLEFRDDMFNDYWIWEVENSRMLAWPWYGSDRISHNGGSQFVVSQGLPVGFGLSALMLVALAMAFTPGAAGRSVWNWVWGTKLRMNSPADLPGGSWTGRVAIVSFGGWRILGAWALIVWLVTTASAMLTAESQDRRAFGSEATAEVLWNDYLKAIEEIRGDEVLMERLRDPEPYRIRHSLFCYPGSE